MSIRKTMLAGAAALGMFGAQADNCSNWAKVKTALGSGDGELQVFGRPDEFGTPSPAYGSSTLEGDTLELSPGPLEEYADGEKAVPVADGVRARCLGWVRNGDYSVTNAIPVDPVQAAGLTSVDWIWQRQYRFTANAAWGCPSVTLNGVTDATVTKWVSEGEAVTVTAEPDDSDCVTIAWHCAPAGAVFDIETSTMTFSATVPATVTPLVVEKDSIRYWRGTTASASVIGNWVDFYGDHQLPENGSTVILDSGSQDMTWDLNDTTVGNWIQDGYAGTVTFMTGAGGVASGKPQMTYGVLMPDLSTRSFEVSCDVILNTGTWTHPPQPEFFEDEPGLTTGNGIWRIVVHVGGDFDVGANALITADNAGFRKNQGPGAAVNNGAGHGGTGSDGASYAFCSNSYGCVREPITHGSGTSSTVGGGAIEIAIGGMFMHNGVLSASMTEDAEWNTGSGGSIFLVAGFICGSGSILCESRASEGGSGSGGRIALELTGNGADFGDFTGLLRCCGSTPDSHPGTIYRATKMNRNDGGILEIKGRGNQTQGYSGQYTLLQGDEDFTFAKVILSDGVMLGVGPEVLLKTEEIDSSTSDNCIALVGGTLEVPDNYVITNCTLRGEFYPSCIRSETGASGKVCFGDGSKFVIGPRKTSVSGSLDLQNGSSIVVDRAGDAVEVGGVLSPAAQGTVTINLTPEEIETLGSDSLKLFDAAVDGSFTEWTALLPASPGITAELSVRDGAVYVDMSAPPAVVGWPKYGFVADANQDGTSEHPWQIGTAQRLFDLAEAIADTNCVSRDVYFIQTADIDMGGAGVFPGIGDEDHPFEGAYDGGNHKISNILHKDMPYAGLFNVVRGYGSSGGSVRNLRIDTMTFVSAAPPTEFGGAFFVGVADNNATMINLTAMGTLASAEHPSTHCIAGICAKAGDAGFESCTNNATLHLGCTVAGGVCAFVAGGSAAFSGCADNGAIVVHEGCYTEALGFDSDRQGGSDGVASILGRVQMEGGSPYNVGFDRCFANGTIETGGCEAPCVASFLGKVGDKSAACAISGGEANRTRMTGTPTVKVINGLDVSSLAFGFVNDGIAELADPEGDFQLDRYYMVMNGGAVFAFADADAGHYIVLDESYFDADISVANPEEYYLFDEVGFDGHRFEARAKLVPEISVSIEPAVAEYVESMAFPVPTVTTDRAYSGAWDPEEITEPAAGTTNTYTYTVTVAGTDTSVQRQASATFKVYKQSVPPPDPLKPGEKAHYDTQSAAETAAAVTGVAVPDEVAAAGIDVETYKALFEPVVVPSAGGEGYDVKIDMTEAAKNHERNDVLPAQLTKVIEEKPESSNKNLLFDVETTGTPGLYYSLQSCDSLTASEAEWFNGEWDRQLCDKDGKVKLRVPYKPGGSYYRGKAYMTADEIPAGVK